MILFLTLVLLFLMITIGGERGAVSIMALAEIGRASCRERV